MVLLLDEVWLVYAFYCLGVVKRFLGGGGKFSGRAPDQSHEVS